MDAKKSSQQPRDSQPQLTVDEAYTQALDHFNGQRYTETDRLCTSIIKSVPNHIYAINLLGLTAQKVNRHDIAIELFQKALNIDNSLAWLYYNLGTSLYPLGRIDDVVKALKKAIEIQPVYSEAYSSLGNALTELGMLDEAVVNLHKAISIQPDFAQAHYNLGNALKEQGKLDAGVTCYQKAIAIQPDFADVHCNLGNTFLAQGKLDPAVASYQKVIEIQPDFAQAHSNLGNALQEQGKLEEAVISYQNAIAIQPIYAEAYSNLGNTLQMQGELEKAITSYQKAIAIQPDIAEAHYNLGIILLSMGDFENGWQNYEWRFKVKLYDSYYKHLPQWDGSSLEGKTILLCREQGFGDNIQFVRYAGLLKNMGATVVVVCQQPLKSIFKTVAGIDKLLTENDTIPYCDCYIHMLSLPFLFGTTLDNIPNNVPYLYPDKTQRREILKKTSVIEAFKVGIVWRGNSSHKNDENRSINPNKLAEILDIDSCIFINLQKDSTEDELAAFVGRKNFIDFSHTLTDFSDTATIISKLDLIISVDTSIAHLSGALGVATWIMLPFSPDWRWLRGRDDTPWYPSVSLFRQSTPKGWDKVIKMIKEELTRKTN
jgi:tetratricopeptide (TPR) repeat protein